VKELNKIWESTYKMIKFGIYGRKGNYCCSGHRWLSKKSENLNLDESFHIFVSVSINPDKILNIQVYGQRYLGEIYVANV
jgi:hypothetical protein